jgi:hypothetical protein
MTNNANTVTSIGREGNWESLMRKTGYHKSTTTERTTDNNKWISEEEDDFSDSTLTTATTTNRNYAKHTTPTRVLTYLTTLTFILILTSLTSPTFARNPYPSTQITTSFLSTSTSSSSFGITINPPHQQQKSTWYVGSRVLLISALFIQVIIMYVTVGVDIASRNGVKKKVDYEVNGGDGYETTGIINSRKITSDDDEEWGFVKCMYPWIETSLLFRYQLWIIIGGLEVLVGGMTAGTVMLVFYEGTEEEVREKRGKGIRFRYKANGHS